MTCAVMRNPLRAPGLSCENTQMSDGRGTGTTEAPVLVDRGFVVLAEAEGFEPSMGFKTQTALAVRRHRPD